MRKSFGLMALAAAGLVASGVLANAEDRADRVKDRAAPDRAQAHVDQRENRQAERIDQGVDKGSITPAEAATLDAQQQSIADMADKFESEGKLTPEEVGQLSKALNTASVNIWAEKRNTTGVQQPVYLLGKNVTLNPATAAALANPDLTPQQARSFARDFGSMLRIKRSLAMDDLTPDQRSALRTQYNDLLNKNFVVQNPHPAEARVDQRENHQAARIDQGIKNGALTPEEVTALQSQQKSIAAMASQFESEGKLTPDEFGQIRQALNTASASIWADKHNSDGHQDPVYRLGKNVFLNPEMAAKLDNSTLTPEEARVVADNFWRMLRLKRLLATQGLTPEQRERLQARYNDFLNKYFVVQNPAPASAPTTTATPATTAQ